MLRACTMLGAEVIAVTAGSATLKDAINEAFRDWVTNVETTNYIFGTAAGPHPFPEMVRDLQRVIGDEARVSCSPPRGACPTSSWPAWAAAPTRLAHSPHSSMIPASSCSVARRPETASRLGDTPRRSLLTRWVCFTVPARSSCRSATARRRPPTPFPPAWTTPGVGPQHAWLARSGRASYIPISDAEAMDAFLHLSRTEGIIPAIESSHALAGVRAWAGAKRRLRGPSHLVRNPSRS